VYLRPAVWSVLMATLFFFLVPGPLSAQQGCSFSVSGMPAGNVPAAGGSYGPVNIIASNSSCDRQLGSDAAWITISYGASGTGNGTFGFTVAPNTSVQPRTGNIVVTNTPTGNVQRFAVNQAGASCSYSLSSASTTSAGAGGNGSFTVTTTAAECAWTAVSSMSWIHVNSPTSTAQGSGTVNYSVDANSTSGARTGTIVVANLTFTITQSVPCTFTISPPAISAPAAGMQGSIDVSPSVSTCAWQAVVASGASWLTITSASSGTGHGAVDYTIQPASSSAARSTTLTVAGIAIPVTQAGNDCTITVNPTSQSLPPYAVTGTINVSAATGCSWTAASSASWLTISSGASGTASGAVSYSAAANNTGQQRSATIAIGNAQVAITQATNTCSLTAYPILFSFDVNGGTGTTNVTAVPASCTWTATSNNTDWIQVTAAGPGSGNGSVTFAVAPNGSVSSRNGSISIGSQMVTVTQAGQACSLQVTPVSASAPVGGGTGSFSVVATSGCSWTAVPNVPWITVTSNASGAGNGTVAYSVAANS
jgi:hypothetical protein